MQDNFTSVGKTEMIIILKIRTFPPFATHAVPPLNKDKAHNDPTAYLHDV